MLIKILILLYNVQKSLQLVHTAEDVQDSIYIYKKGGFKLVLSLPHPPQF